MPLRVQTNRSSTKNQRPTTGSREPGELFVNLADLQLGVSNAAKVSTDLIGVRYFSTATNYTTGDFVINSGQLYRANQAVVSGAFNSSQWNKIPLVTEAEAPIAAGTTSQYWRGDKSWQTLDKTAVGLSNVDNTSDANKPVSTAQQTALNLKANLASPTFTGDPQAPTPAPGDADTSIATTAFVATSFAPITSPLFAGDPRAPTPATADNDTSIATTAHVKANLATYAPLASPALTGNPTSATPSPGDNDTSIATTAFVQTAIGNRPTDAPSDANSYGRKAGAWVDVAEEAPADGVSYGRKNGAWVASVGGAVVSDTAPGAPLIQGQLWYEADSGNTFLWYDDGTSSQWVQVNVQPAAAVSPTAGLTAETRSRVVNGAMQVSQENGNATTGFLITMSGYRAADQWSVQTATGTGTLSAQRVQVVTPNGSKDRIRLTVGTAKATLAATEYAQIVQHIEGIRTADFLWGTASAKQVVARFGFKAPAGSYSLSIMNGAANRSYVAMFTIAAGQANTDTVQTFVVPGDTTGTWPTDTSMWCFLRVVIACGTSLQNAAGWTAGDAMATSAISNGMATAGNVFELYDVGLYMDPLNTGTPPAWTMPDEAQELAACMRYWEKISAFSHIFSGNVTTGGSYYRGSTWMVSKRVMPSMSGSGPAVVGFPVAAGGFSTSGSGVLTGFYETRVANATANSAYYQTDVVGNARM